MAATIPALAGIITTVAANTMSTTATAITGGAVQDTTKTRNPNGLRIALLLANPTRHGRGRG
jgi:hypothetical protein